MFELKIWLVTGVHQRRWRSNWRRADFTQKSLCHDCRKHRFSEMLLRYYRRKPKHRVFRFLGLLFHLVTAESHSCFVFTTFLFLTLLTFWVARRVQEISVFENHSEILNVDFFALFLHVLGFVTKLGRAWFVSRGSLAVVFMITYFDVVIALTLSVCVRAHF